MMLTCRLKLQTDHNERHATWLEAFYDLVFVFVISSVMGYLSDYPSFDSIGFFMLSLLPAWWLWVDFSYYFDQFGDEDPITRIGLFASMLLILYMGLIMMDISHNTQYFNIVYGLQRLLITFLYYRAWKYVPEARSTSKKFLIGFMLSLSLWTIALLFTGPVKFILWGIALGIEILTGPVIYATTKSPPGFTSHMPERFGIFLIMVLGETIMSVASGLEHVNLSPASVITSFLGFLIGVNVWWLYFSRIREERITHALQGGRKTLLGSYIYGYSHLFIYGGIGIIGSGMLLCFKTTAHLPLPYGARVVLCSGLIFYLVALYIVQRTCNTGFRKIYTAVNLALVLVCAALIPWGVTLSPNSVLAIITTAISAFSLCVWKTDIEKPIA